MTDYSQAFDHQYWGPEGPKPSKWGAACGQGIRYEDHGLVTDGQAGAVRKLGGSRKARGMASDPKAVKK